MCGIAGICYLDRSRPVSPALLKRLGAAITHRGPDGEGTWIGPGVGLVQRRLSIIDLEGGRQPMGNEDDTIQIVFNGEIYNYQSLRDDLARSGHRLRTKSDTEVIVHLYEEMGDDVVQGLRGMFAFALWDGNRQRLLLARDRVGIKPLYYYRDGAKLVFGSELKAILADPEVSRRINPAAVEDYLAYGMVPGNESIFRDMHKLPAGHTLALAAGAWNAEPRRYWQLCIEPDPNLQPDEWQDRIRQKLRETVRMHLIADVPVGAFLSGGADSSIVVASAAGSTKGALQTFSMGFQEEAFSELPWARKVAGQFHTQHVEEIVTPGAIELLDQLTHYYDEPFADSSAIPTFLVSRLAARHVKVVLSGDGGDEAFGGYARYAHDLREAALRSWLPAWVRGSLLGPLARAWPKADWLPRPLRVKTALTNLSLDPAQAYANTLTICRSPLRRSLLSRDLTSSLNGHDPGRLIRQAYGATHDHDPLAGMIAADVEVLLPDDFLVKVDRASMANGLEVRPPFLDHELLEMAARIPSHFKVHQGQTKWILKQAFSGVLPGEVLWRKKQGFEIPIDAWLRGPLADLFESSVLAAGAWAGDLIDRDAATRLFRSHRSGTGRFGNILWSLLVLARWANRYLSPPSNLGSACTR